MTERRRDTRGDVPHLGSEPSGDLSFSLDDESWHEGDYTGPRPSGEHNAVSAAAAADTENGSRRDTVESGLPAAIEPIPREESSWNPALAREEPFLGASARLSARPSPEATPKRQPPARDPTPNQRPAPASRPNPSRVAVPLHAPPPPHQMTPPSWRRDSKRDDSALLGSTGHSSLDAPRRLVDLGTGLPSFTSLFSDLKPLAEDQAGMTVLYVHVPSSAIVEERFGWEALEAYRGLVANFLVGYAQDVRRERGGCVVARAFADDFVIVTTHRDQDDQLSSALADSMTRHLLAVDEETAALLQVYVGVAAGKLFGKVHPERLLYRLIQHAQTEATDVVRQKISAHVRILDRCISGELFQMVYQPIARIDDHSIFAYEALVRCTQKELRSPHVLFNVAEQGDRIWPLSRLLRRMALGDVPDLPAGTHMFVNLHPRDFDDPDILEPDGPIALHAPRVVLEVTERAAILDMDAFRKKIAVLRSFGARIAIDDLGSGYSALNLVAELNPDFIKLDMTLIRSVDESPVRQNLLRNMVAFAYDLGAQVVAEGVETRAELETLCELGCHMVQGFYLAVPSPPFVTAIQAPPARPRAPVPA